MSITGVPRGGAYGLYQTQAIQSYVTALANQQSGDALTVVTNLFNGQAKAEGLLQSIVTAQALPFEDLSLDVAAQTIKVTAGSVPVLMNTSVTGDQDPTHFVTWDTVDHEDVTFPVTVVTDWATSLAQADMCSYLNVAQADITDHIACRVRGAVILFGKQKTATSNIVSTTYTYSVLVSGSSVASSSPVTYTGSNYVSTTIDFIGPWRLLSDSTNVPLVVGLQANAATVTNSGDVIDFTGATSQNGSLVQIQLEYGLV